MSIPTRAPAVENGKMVRFKILVLGEIASFPDNCFLPSDKPPMNRVQVHALSATHAMEHSFGNGDEFSSDESETFDEHLGDRAPIEMKTCTIGGVDDSDDDADDSHGWLAD